MEAVLHAMPVQPPAPVPRTTDVVFTRYLLHQYVFLWVSSSLNDGFGAVVHKLDPVCTTPRSVAASHASKSGLPSDHPHEA